MNTLHDLKKATDSFPSGNKMPVWFIGPDHYFPMIYSLGLISDKDEIGHALL